MSQQEEQMTSERWRWEDDSLRSPGGFYFDLDAPGFKEYVVGLLNSHYGRVADHEAAASGVSGTGEAALREAVEALFGVWDNWVAYQNEWHDIRDGSPPKDFFNQVDRRIRELRAALTPPEAGTEGT